MALFHCGFTSSRVISTLYVLHLGYPSWAVGLILSLYALIPSFIAIHVGKWVDKIGIRIPIFAASCFLLSAMACPILLPHDVFGVFPVLLTCLLAGTGFLFVLITGQGLIGHIASNKTRATAFTYQAMAFSGSSSLGPLIAGYLIDLGSYSYAYAVAFGFIAVALVDFLVVLRILPSSVNNAAKAKAPKRGAFDLFHVPAVRNVLIASGVVSMAWDLQSFMIPVYGTEIGLNAIEIGWLLSTFSVCTFGVRIFMPFLSRIFEEWQIIIGVLILSGMAYLAFPFFTSLAVLFFLSGWLGATLGASQPNVMSLLHQKSPDGRVGEAIGIRTMITNATHTVLPLLFGFGGNVVGAATAFWVLGTGMLGCGAFLRSSNKKQGIKDSKLEAVSAEEGAKEEEKQVLP